MPLTFDVPRTSDTVHSQLVRHPAIICFYRESKIDERDETVERLDRKERGGPVLLPGHMGLCPRGSFLPRPQRGPCPSPRTRGAVSTGLLLTPDLRGRCASPRTRGAMSAGLLLAPDLRGPCASPRTRGAVSTGLLLAPSHSGAPGHQHPEKTLLTYVANQLCLHPPGPSPLPRSR